MQTVEVRLRPSVSLQATLCFIHLLSLVSVAACEMGWTARIVFFMAILSSLAQEFCWRGKSLSRIVEITACSDGTLACKRADGSAVNFEIGPRSIILPWVLLLHPVRSPEQSLPLLIARDSADEEQYRLLRLWLLQRREFTAIAEVSS